MPRPEQPETTLQDIGIAMDACMNRIAIIGATGEVGFRLVRALHASWRIVAIIRDPGKRDFSPYPGVELRQVADIGDVDGLALALDGCDAIVNTGYIWFAEPIHQAIMKSGVSIRHIVFTGSTGIFTRLPSASAERKREAEAFIQAQYRCAWTILRPTMIYGHKDDRNISRLIKAVARYPVMPLIGHGSSLIQPVLIHDLIRAYRTALLNPKYFNKSYNIAGGKAYSNRDLIACVASSVGRRARLIPLPPVLVHAGVALLSMAGLSPVTREQVDRFQENKDVDLSAFVTDFEFVPRDMEHGLAFLVRDLTEHGQLTPQ
jgi:nucleoside-diphosphate-sugar epimerase